jgi:hypothetical protein
LYSVSPHFGVSTEDEESPLSAELELGSASAELELGSTSAELELGSASAELELGSASTELELGGVSTELELEGVSTDDEDKEMPSRVIFCVGFSPISMLSAYAESKYPAAETVISQVPNAPASSFFNGEKTPPNETSMFIPPPWWAKRVEKVLPPPLTCST